MVVDGWPTLRKGKEKLIFGLVGVCPLSIEEDVLAQVGRKNT